MISRFSEHPTQSFWIMLFCVAVITALRVWFLNVSDFNLFFDEAQYWFWAKHPDVGYYSKPPMVAWIITLTTSFCGDGEACIRLGSPLLHAGTSIVLYFLGRNLYSTRVGFYSALTYLFLPAVVLSSSLVSTDPPLLFFWALSLLFFHLALHKDQFKYWVLAGVCAGLGMMSKYNMLMFLVSAVWYLSAYEEYRTKLTSKGFWCAVTLALLLFLPNLWWNAENGFVSFLHTKDNATGNNQYFNVSELLEFVGAQFLVFGPILFLALLIAIWRFIGDRPFFLKDRSTALLFMMVLPLFYTILVVSFMTRAHANWAAPIYVPATVLIVHFILSVWNKKSWLMVSSTLHILLMVLFFYVALAPKPFGLLLSEQTNIAEKQIRDPFTRLKGWKALAKHVSDLRKEIGGEVVLLTHRRKTFAELMYYADPPFYHAVNWQEDELPRDHFMLVTSKEDLIGKNVLYVAEYNVSQAITRHFLEAEMLSQVDIPVTHDVTRHYEIMLLKGYQDEGLTHR